VVYTVTIAAQTKGTESFTHQRGGAMATNALGELLRKWREQERISLRQFSINVGLDPSNYSRIERGVGPRPTEEVLERIAKGFGIEVREEDRWYEMIDAVSGDRGEFPDYLREQQEIASSLPAFFRTLRTEGASSPEGMYDLFVKVLKER
jgi:transcriptional regulator with XRE-family HTH domain